MQPDRSIGLIRAQHGAYHAHYVCAYLLCAVCPERAVGAGPVTFHADTEAINLHMAKISKGVSPDAHTALVTNGAGWYSSEKLIVASNITLGGLPPGAPELNPIGNVFDYVRGTKLACRLSHLTATS